MRRVTQSSSLRRALLRTSVCAALLVGGAAHAAKASFDLQAWLAGSDGKTIDVIAHLASAPMVITPGDAVGTGLVDDLTRPSNDGQVPMPDTAVLLRDKLLEQLQPLTGATFRTREPLPPGRVKKPAAYRELSQADYVLAVSMNLHMIRYRAGGWATYFYQDKINVRLIDNHSGTLLFESREGFTPDKDDPAMNFSREDFAASDGQKVRDAIAATIDRNIHDLLSHAHITPAPRQLTPQ
jgi:hypothetical protein